MSADEQLQQNLTTPYPHPPPFYKHFTPANLSAVQAIRESSANAANTKPEDTELKPSDVPPELRYLIPPLPPNEDDASQLYVFNELPIAPPTQPTADTPRLLMHHVRSLLLHYLALIGTLAHNPIEYGEIVNTLHAKFAQAHALVNQYRPYQARETLVEVLEGMVSRRRAELRGVEEMKVKVDEILRGLGGDGGVEDAVAVDGGRSREEEESKQREMRKEAARRVWKALDAIGT